MKIGDVVKVRGQDMVVCEIHKPTMEHEAELVSLRPSGVDKGQNYPGWPSHTYLTLPVKAVSAGQGCFMNCMLCRKPISAKAAVNFVDNTDPKQGAAHAACANKLSDKLGRLKLYERMLKEAQGLLIAGDDEADHKIDLSTRIGKVLRFQ